MQNFRTLGQTLLGEKKPHQREDEEKKITRIVVTYFASAGACTSLGLIRILRLICSQGFTLSRSYPLRFAQSPKVTAILNLHTQSLPVHFRHRVAHYWLRVRDDRPATSSWNKRLFLTHSYNKFQ